MFKNNKKRTNKRKRNEIPVTLECYFCKLKQDPDFKEILKLRRFINDRGKMIGKSRSGTCSNHQRMLSREIKKARFLSLIPYTERHAL